jgi:hypothetical protein
MKAGHDYLIRKDKRVGHGGKQIKEKKDSNGRQSKEEQKKETMGDIGRQDKWGDNGRHCMAQKE